MGSVDVAPPMDDDPRPGPDDSDSNGSEDVFMPRPGPSGLGKRQRDEPEVLLYRLSYS